MQTELANAIVATAIAQFAEDLKNCGCMGTRRDSIRFLANKIGSEKAIMIAKVFGLTEAFYFN